MRRLSVKSQLIVFLLVFAGYVCFRNRDVSFLRTEFLALACTALADSIVTYIKVRQWRLGESSVVSGLIIGYVLSSDNAWWVIAVAALLAISSKHLFRFRKRHVFNPAAFGILLSIFMCGATTQWQGTYLWYILVPAGCYFIYRIRKFEVIIGYAVAAVLLFGAQAVLQRMPLQNIFGYFSYFYICIMLIEPKTSPPGQTGKFVFGAIVAVLIFVFNQTGIRVDAELLSLLIGNLTVPLLQGTRSTRP